MDFLSLNLRKLDNLSELINTCAKIVLSHMDQVVF